MVNFRSGHGWQIQKLNLVNVKIRFGSLRFKKNLRRLFQSEIYQLTRKEGVPPVFVLDRGRRYLSWSSPGRGRGGWYPSPKTRLGNPIPPWPKTRTWYPLSIIRTGPGSRYLLPVDRHTPVKQVHTFPILRMRAVKMTTVKSLTV